MTEITKKMEFMRKDRFNRIRDKFNTIDEKAQIIIDNAEDNQILKLSLTFNSPVKIVEAEIFDENKFLDLAF